MLNTNTEFVLSLITIKVREMDNIDNQLDAKITVC